MDTRLTPEETEKLLNGITELLSKRHHLGVESAYADAQDIVSVFKSILAKLAAVPLDENMVHNCNKFIAKFLRDFDNEAHQYPIPILTQLLLSQLSIYCNAKEIQARLPDSEIAKLLKFALDREYKSGGITVYSIDVYPLLDAQAEYTKQSLLDSVDTPEGKQA